MPDEKEYGNGAVEPSEVLCSITTKFDDSARLADSHTSGSHPASAHSHRTKWGPSRSSPRQNRCYQHGGYDASFVCYTA
jgi:hypothetical protein